MVSDDAVTVKKEAAVVNAKVAEAAAKMKSRAEQHAIRLEQRLAKSAAGGRLLKLGKSTAEVMAQLRNELGLAADEAPTAGALAALVEPMRVDRLAEHIKSLRADQVCSVTK
eukprot:SAG31_NODE_584_length_13886_cov_96.615000_1_plen_112_part_00